MIFDSPKWHISQKCFLLPDGAVTASTWPMLTSQTLSSCYALQAVTSDLSPVPVRDLNSLVWTPDCDCTHCCQMQCRSKALPHIFEFGSYRGLLFLPPLLEKEWREGKKKVKERHTERQLPQLLAGVLIKTKLVSLREQTWQALRLRSFFHSCQDVKWVQVPQECQRLVRGRDRSDLSLSFTVFLSLLLSLCT